MPSSNKYIDAHLHLQDERFLPSTLIEIIERASVSGVERMLCNATSENDWQKVLNLATTYSSIVPSLGVHPWYADTITHGWEQRLDTLCKTTGALIGEIGLDKMCHVPLAEQERVFCKQLDIASQHQLTVSIHCVKCWGRILDILQKQSLTESSIIIHSFSGSTQVMDRLLQLDAFISFSTQLANPSRKKTKLAFMAMPFNRLLLETDAPDQFCKELDIKKSSANRQINEPALIPFLYQYAAKLRKIDIRPFTQILWDNGNSVM